MNAKYCDGFESSPDVRAPDNNNGATAISNEAKNRRVIFMDRCYKQCAKKKSLSEGIPGLNRLRSASDKIPTRQHSVARRLIDTVTTHSFRQSRLFLFFF